MRSRVERAMNSAYKRLKLEYKYDPSDHVYVTVFDISESLRRVRQIVIHDDDHLVFFTTYPESADLKMLNSLCREINEMNCHTKVGGYIVDSEDGNIGFHSSVSLMGGVPSTEVLMEHMLLGAAGMSEFEKNVWNSYRDFDGRDPSVR